MSFGSGAHSNLARRRRRRSLRERGGWVRGGNPPSIVRQKQRQRHPQSPFQFQLICMSIDLPLALRWRRRCENERLRAVVVLPSVDPYFSTILFYMSTTLKELSVEGAGEKSLPFFPHFERCAPLTIKKFSLLYVMNRYMGWCTYLVISCVMIVRSPLRAHTRSRASFFFFFGCFLLRSHQLFNVWWYKRVEKVASSSIWTRSLGGTKTSLSDL